MMNPFFLIVIALILTIDGGLNYYVGLRGWQALFSYLPFLNFKVYWLLFFLISSAYLLSRLVEKYLPTVLFEG